MNLTFLAPFWRIFFPTFVLLVFLYFNLSIVRYYISNIGIFFAIPIIAWNISKIIRNLCHKTFVSPANKAVLVTGCDSGFGHLAAKALDTYGFHVFAGCLDPSGIGAQRLYKTTSNRLRILKLDVTIEEDIQDAIKEIEECELQLWGLVNNAAIADSSFIEWGSGIDRFEKLFKVNVLGLIKMTKACLPLIRKSKGRILNISSVFGRIIFEGSIPYCMTKFAVRAFTDGLRREMALYGVKIVCVEPFLYETNLTNKVRIMNNIEEIWKETPKEIRDFYGEEFKERKKKTWSNFLQYKRSELNEVVDAIEEGITASNPLEYYRVCGALERPLLWIAEYLPDAFLDAIISGSSVDFIVRILNLRFWRRERI